MAIGRTQHETGPGTISLTKATPTINLTKPGEPQGIVQVNLNWSTRSKGLFRRTKPVDLDLGCLYELTDGNKGVIQAAGDNFGSLQTSPHIALDTDDRSGERAHGENLHIDLARPELFRRILIFAFRYEGTPNWAAADAVATIFPTWGPNIEVRLDSPVSGVRSCVIALLHNQGAGITVQREVHYIDGTQRDIDSAYRWGITWNTAHK